MYSFQDNQQSYRLLQFIHSQSQRLCQQFETHPNQMDLDFIYTRYENLLSILERCVRNGVFCEIDDILYSMQRVLHLLQAQSTQSTHGFRPARIRTGDRGCPYWDISPEQLEYLLEFNFTVKEIARLFCVSYRTIRRRMSEYSLSVRMYYTAITDAELRQVVSDFITECPDSGIKRVSGFLNSVGLRWVFMHCTQWLYIGIPLNNCNGPLDAPQNQPHERETPAKPFHFCMLTASKKWDRVTIICSAWTISHILRDVFSLQY